MRIETTRWTWLAMLALGLARPAAADDTAPARAEAAAPARDRYRVAVLDMPAPRERAQAASVVVTAVREAARADERLDVVPEELVEQARVVWGGRDVLVLSGQGVAGSGMEGGSADMTHTQACAIGYAAGAERLLLVSGYELEIGQASGATQARLGATLTLINVDSCKVREKAEVGAAATGASVEEALAGGRAALAQAAGRRLQGLLPLHSEVRAVRAGGGAMAHGARDGVRPGQYFDVRRDDGVVGHVYVDDVDEDSADVSLVHGVRRLAAGDRLIERKPVRVFEVGLTATPSMIERVEGAGEIGVAAAVHGMLYRPVDSNLYRVSVERLSVTDFSRWRVGAEVGRQFRIVPRRLFAYARLGAGLVWANQTLRETPYYYNFYGGGHVRGWEITNALGARYTLGDGLVLDLGASMPIPLHQDTWWYDWHTREKVPEMELTYTGQKRWMPTVSLGLGWRF